MEIRICVWNWADYNNGNGNWKWFTLPSQELDLENYMEELKEQGREEFFICDSEHSFISENTSIKALIELTQYEEFDVLEEYYQEYPDKIINDMSDFDDLFHGVDPIRIANTIHFGSYNPSHDYFTFDGYGNIETLSDYEKEEREQEYINYQIKEMLASM